MSFSVVCRKPAFPKVSGLKPTTVITIELEQFLTDEEMMIARPLLAKALADVEIPESKHRATRKALESLKVKLVAELTK